MSTTSETKDSEIDEQVATEIMGWKRIDPSTNDGYETIDWVAPAESPVHGGTTPWMCNRRYLPSFSASHNHAAEVVQKLREMKLDISIAIQSHHKRWEVDMYGGSPHVLASIHDESLPRAICRCALEVVRAMRGPNAEE
jgi:hypothetical protein